MRFFWTTETYVQDSIASFEHKTWPRFGILFFFLFTDHHCQLSAGLQGNVFLCLGYPYLFLYRRDKSIHCLYVLPRHSESCSNTVFMMYNITSSILGISAGAINGSTAVISQSLLEKPGVEGMFVLGIDVPSTISVYCQRLWSGLATQSFTKERRALIHTDNIKQTMVPGGLRFHYTGALTIWMDTNSLISHQVWNSITSPNEIGSHGVCVSASVMICSQ
jgi:hypothetical protein